VGRIRVGRRLAVTLVVAAALAGGCGKQNPTEETRPVEGGAAQAVDIDVVDFAFRPKVVATKGGGDVVVTLSNEGAVSHTFTIDDPALDHELAPGETWTTRIPATPGVSFFCRFHPSTMHGQICPGNANCGGRA
jgi:plastocyanin